MRSTKWRSLVSKAGLVVLSAALACPAVAAPQQPGAGQQSVNLLVAAAASLKDVLTELGAKYTKLHPDVTTSFNLGGSGTLQRQIENGAPIDLFISAGPKNMEELDDEHLVDPATRRLLARNDLVLIVPTRGEVAIRGFRDLAAAGTQRVAIGEPNSVPAGQYARETLITLGLWSQVEPKTVQCKDVREVLIQVESGNVDAGFVYRTDASIGKGIRVVATAPPSSHSPIAYPACVVTAAPHRAVALSFLAYLASPGAASVWRRYHFIVP